MPQLEKYKELLLKWNKTHNLVSKSQARNLDEHIEDSLSVSDLLGPEVLDLGSGGGFPGIIIAIIAKHQKRKVKINLFEKSHHKSSFLREVTRKLNLDTDIIQKDIFEISEINTGSIIARAFKPMPIILELVNKKFKEYENLILFMGKNGKKVLEESTNEWKFDYIEKKSLTSEDSFLLNIRNIKKKFLK